MAKQERSGKSDGRTPLSIVRHLPVSRSPHQRTSRALVKTLLYRTLMVVITITVAFLFTGDAGDALSIGIASNVIKTGTYYGYERLWDRISWGLSR